MAIVTLITDFGTRDGYVGEMKGVLLDRCPTAHLVDVTHEIEPGDIPGAAWVLGRIWERYPAGAVHLVVVDPGVGGDRRAVVVEHDGRWFVGPDNGLIFEGHSRRSCGRPADRPRFPGSRARQRHLPRSGPLLSGGGLAGRRR